MSAKKNYPKEAFGDNVLQIIQLQLWYTAAITVKSYSVCNKLKWGRQIQPEKMNAQFCIQYLCLLIPGIN